MKKIISLTILPGLFAFFVIFIILSAPVSKASSSSPSAVGDKTRPEQTGPPWYNEAWHYRRPVVISNSGGFINFYQVMIKLDNTNFNFNLAKVDGSDIRFTDSSGKNPLLFWIESWDKQDQLAYLWVLVSSIVPEPYDTTIYLYYDNPDAQSMSDGPNTFDSFDDDWNQFTGERFNQAGASQILPTPNDVNSPFDWFTISGAPTALSGILNLENGEGIKSTSTYLYNAVGMRANFGLGNGNEWGGFINESGGQRTIIGDLPSDSENLYLIDYKNIFDNVLLPRVGGNDWHNGYHVYEVRWNSGQSIGDIDHGLITVLSNLPSEVPDNSLPVTLYNNNSIGNPTLKIDWVYIRQYRDPEPTFSVKAEQALVELSIENTDYPDPVRKDAKLTYQLTITNTNSINAPGVVVTDTLPENVQIGPISPSQGSCESGNIILCDLDTIHANSMASITIIVTPTIDGEIINTAVVSSPSYELDLGNNTSEQSTLVDSQSPEVNWVKPVSNGNTFFSFGGTVSLETTATDNDQVDRVEYWWYDGVTYWHIYTDTTPPYQASFDTRVLVPGLPYWFEARAYDRAGNSNFPYNRSNIYIVRPYIDLLPLVRR